MQLAELTCPFGVGRTKNVDARSRCESREVRSEKGGEFPRLLVDWLGHASSSSQTSACNKRTRWRLLENAGGRFSLLSQVSQEGVKQRNQCLQRERIYDDDDDNHDDNDDNDEDDAGDDDEDDYDNNDDCDKDEDDDREAE